LIQAYWNLKLRPSEVRPPVLALLPPLELPVSWLVVSLSSSPPHAARTSKRMPIKIGNVNFLNFAIGVPPPDLSYPVSVVAPHQRPRRFTMPGEPEYKLS
jgi:hypothetical protein